MSVRYRNLKELNDAVISFYEFHPERNYRVDDVIDEMLDAMSSHPTFPTRFPDTWKKTRSWRV